MNNIKASIGLENLVLAGITFIRDYIQFLFDGPTLNFYTLPIVVKGKDLFENNSKGYYDELCSLIGKEISLSFEDNVNQYICICFVDGTEVRVSLKEEDKECVEVAMLRMKPDGAWKIW